MSTEGCEKICSDFIYKSVPKNERADKYKVVVSGEPINGAIPIFVETQGKEGMLHWGTNPKRLRGKFYYETSKLLLDSFSGEERKQKNIPVWVKITPIKS